MIAVHLRSVFLATRLVLPMMYRQNSGKIVNTASQLAYKASPGLPQPQAAKIFRTPATSADPPAKRMSWPDFGDQEYAITLTRNDMTYQFLGLAVPYISAVSINVTPSEMPSRNASSSSVSGCRPWPKRAEP
jgi:hypothetical protein